MDPIVSNLSDYVTTPASVWESLQRIRSSLEALLRRLPVNNVPNCVEVFYLTILILKAVDN